MMMDIAYIVAVLAFFALCGVIVKGFERL